MVRTTDTEVKEIIEIDDSIDLTPFIAAANALVTLCCTGDAVKTAYTTEHLTLIETWLSAHMYTIRDPRTETEKAGSVAAKYQSKVDLGFDTSHYGQTAMRLDNQGGLSKLNEQAKKGIVQKIGVTYLGTEPDSVIN